MPERARDRSFYILFLLFLINLMNFFDRTIPAVVLEPIRKEFALDDTALGLLGASFTLIYAVAGIPLGYLADRFRRTGILAAGLTVWSVLTAASGTCWLENASEGWQRRHDTATAHGDNFHSST
jgi:MFS family permease